MPGVDVSRPPRHLKERPRPFRRRPMPTPKQSSDGGLPTPESTKTSPTKRFYVSALIRHAWNDRMTRSSILLMLTTVGNSLVGYVFWVVCARSFSASAVGTVSAVVAAGTIAATLSDLGLRTMLMQHLPRERDQQAWSRRVSGALLLGTGSSLVLGTGAILLCPFLATDVSRFINPVVVVLAALFTVCTTINFMLDGVSMSEHRTGQVAVRGGIYGVGKVVVLVALLAMGLRGTLLMFIATVAGVALAVSWAVARQIRRARPDWKFTVRGTGRSLRDVRSALAGHYVLNLGGWLPSFVLPLVVVARSSTQQNAYMTLTWLVGYAFFTISPSVSSALFVQGRWDPDDLRAATRRAAKLIAALLVPAGVAMALLGHWVLGIFGRSYAHYGYPLLLVLVASALPDAVTNVRIGRLRALGQLTAGARLNMGMALASIILAWILVPPLGITGVGVAWLIAQTMGSLWGLIEDRLLPTPRVYEVT